MTGTSWWRKLNFSLETLLPVLLILAGAIGMAASFALTYEKIQVLGLPGYKPACNLNPVLSCGSVMKAGQASIFGVPHSVFGLMAFTALFTFGFLLAGGAKVKKHVWLLAQVAATAGVIFMHYLFFQSVFVLNAICPWCFVVWMVTIPVFWYITQFNLREKYIVLPAPLSIFLQKYHGDILALWYIILFAILLLQFWDYWVTLV